MKFSFFHSVAAMLLASSPLIRAQDEICRGSCEEDDDGNKVCTFTMKVDLFASELGYITFEECGDMINPTLGLELGTTYIFDQSDISNFSHPLGFSYFPDGGHVGKPNLDPDVTPENSASDCAATMSCPSAMHISSEGYLGAYSNNDLIAPMTGHPDTGLRFYGPAFFNSLVDWSATGGWQIALKLDVDDFTQDIFYFCHIHQFMSGRIKIIDSDGLPKQEKDFPALGFEYEEPSEFDKKCGTFNTEQYQLPNSMCQEKFVCDVPEGNEGLKEFSTCIEAMDCAMMIGMTNTVKSNSEVALFIHQMIPHHQNAVNMAKALLKTGKLECDDITNEGNPDCVMEEILRVIINGQNRQIQSMRKVLKAKSYFSEAEEVCTHDQSVRVDKELSASTVISVKMVSLMIGVFTMIGFFIM